MKIALFSDIHANLLAFQAMLQDMDGQKPDAVYCLGGFGWIPHLSQ
nr:metallophosphatase family protein [Pedobacter alluvionis]